jgi:putative ABC transport system permease protein
MYTLRRNVPDDWDSNKFVVVLDSVMPAKAVEPWVHSAIASIDPTVPAEMEVLDQTVNRLADRPRFETALHAFFAFAGLTLAVVGLYGLMAFLTTQRTHEVGIRMAPCRRGLRPAAGLRASAAGERVEGVVERRRRAG